MLQVCKNEIVFKAEETKYIEHRMTKTRFLTE